MRCILLLLALAMVVPAAAAEDPEPANEGGEPDSDPAQDPQAQPQDVLLCQAYEWNGFSGPPQGWVTPDPDGCYRRIIDRVIPPYVASQLWFL